MLNPNAEPASPQPLFARDAEANDSRLALVRQFTRIERTVGLRSHLRSRHWSNPRLSGVIRELAFNSSHWTVTLAELVTIPDFALIVAVPLLRPVTRPVLLIDATPFGDDDQAAVMVRSCTVPLL